MYSALNTTTEVALSKAPNPRLLPGCRSINGCPLLRVCVCTWDGLNAEPEFREWVTILGSMSLHFTILACKTTFLANDLNCMFA